MVRKMMKPKIKMDWDSSRRVVTDTEGTEYVLGKDRAKEVYAANLRLYNKYKKKKI